MHFTDKAALRDQLLAARRALSADSIRSARRAVCAAVLERADASQWRCVGAYVPLRTEPGSTDLLDALGTRGIRVLVPVLRADRDLDWADWDAAAQCAGRPCGLDSIAEADAMLVPALAVARDGTRLGRGGGSYDRALRRLPAEMAVAALLYESELVEALPKDEWDIPVASVVTPSGWIDLGS